MRHARLRLGAWQFAPRRGDVAANLAEVERGLAEAGRHGLDLLVLPELWSTSFLDGGAVTGDEVRRLVEESDAALERVRELSAVHRVAVAGSVYGPEREGGRRPNRLVLLDRGTRVGHADKVHLFSPTAEPFAFAPGDAVPSSFAIGFGRVAGLVCYDLRFPGLVDALAADAPDVLVVPAQWPRERAAHWRALLAGRAVELQCFVVGANRTGTDEIGRRRLVLEFPGNSAIVAPSGEVLAEGRGEPGLVWAEVDAGLVTELRRAVPVARDRRAGFDRQAARVEQRAASEVPEK